MARKFTVAAVGLIIGLAALVWGQHQVAATPVVGAVQWEYKIVLFRGSEARHDDVEAESKLFNQLASEGWEYVGLVATPRGSRDAILGHVAFKRLKK